MSEKALITPPPEGSVPASCPECGEMAGPTRLNRNNPNDVVLVAKECQDNTNEFKKTIPMWNECCGSFKMYLIQLIKTHQGLPYGSDPE